MRELLPARQGTVEGDPPDLAHRRIEKALAALHQSALFGLGHISVEPWRVSADRMLVGTIRADNHGFDLLLRAVSSLQYVTGVLFPCIAGLRIWDES